MALADSQCYGIENPNARVSCFVNKVFVSVFHFIFYLMITCDAHMSLIYMLLFCGFDPETVGFRECG